MVFENGVKNIQATAYNGAHTVYGLSHVVLMHLEAMVFSPNLDFFLKKSLIESK